MKLIILILLAQAAGWADGGTMQFRRDARDLTITVFAARSDVSLLLQSQSGLDPVLDADVSLLLRAGDVEIREHPTRARARNKLLYAAQIQFPKSGKWQIEVTVLRHGQQTRVTGPLNVAPAPNKATSYAGYIAFPPVMIMLFAIRERLLRRRSQK